MTRILLPALIGLTLLTTAPAAPEPRDGDVVAFLGEAATVDMRRHGYLEAALTSRFADRNLQFRNLGWQGDTVYQQHRMPNFGGYDEHLAQQDATVVALWFGHVEAFDGPGRLAEFAQAYQQLLDQIEEHGTEQVLIGPMLQEPQDKPVPDPTEHNDHVHAYAETIRALAAQRDVPFVDLTSLQSSEGAPTLTVNGLLPSPYGHWRVAQQIERELGFESRHWSVQVNPGQVQISTEGTRAARLTVETDAIEFELRDDMLPFPRFSSHQHPERTLTADERALTVPGLASGTWALRVDDQRVAEATHNQWANGVTLTSGPEYAQADKLRRLIERKNENFFRYWRPSNWDFVYGERMGVPASRRHDDAETRWFPDELDEYLPIIAEQEEKITELAQPRTRLYRLERVQENRP